MGQRHRTARRGLALAAAFSLMLGSCASDGSLDKTAVSTVAGSVLVAAGGAVLGEKLGGKTGLIVGGVLGAAAGAWIGNKIGAALDEKDRQKLAEATQQTAVSGEPQTYRNAETGVRVQTRVARTETRKEPVTVPVLQDRVQQVPPLDLIGTPYRVSDRAKVNAANIRSGPGTNYKVVGTLPRGKTVTAVGKVIGQEWYMISEDGAGSGFVATNMLEPAPETAPVPPSAPATGANVASRTVEARRLCRTVEQLVVDKTGKEQTEQVTACKGANGQWEIVS